MDIIHIVNGLQKILPRVLEATVAESLARFPVVVLTGARQTGKSTLAMSSAIGRDRLYLTLDDFDVFERAVADPAALIQAAPRLTLDEVQRAPEVLRAVKRAVDVARRPGRFLLTGSADLLSLRRVSESLAGRAVYLDLWPMTLSERRGRGGAGTWSVLLEADGPADALRGLPGGRVPKTDWRAAVAAGGYPPAAFARDAAERSRWFDGYLRAFLEKDLRDLAAVAALADVRRLMRLAALRLGGLLNQSELARDAALSQPTAHRYLNLLDTAFQVVRLPAYARSRSARMVKSPKLYWGDTGLAAHLAGLASGDGRDEGRLLGPLLENLVLLDLLAWRETTSPRPEVYHWRTAAGAEVDFVIEAGGRLLPVEVKTGAHPRPRDAEGLERFLAEHGRDGRFGVLLHGGDQAFPLSQRVVAVPLERMLGAG